MDISAGRCFCMQVSDFSNDAFYVFKNTDIAQTVSSTVVTDVGDAVARQLVFMESSKTDLNFIALKICNLAEGNKNHSDSHQVTGAQSKPSKSLDMQNHVTEQFRE